MVERGFTLVELCIVLVVMAIISTMAWSQYKHYVVRGRQAEAKTTLLSLVQKLELEREERVANLLVAHQSPYFHFVASASVDDITGFRVWLVQAVPRGMMRGTASFGLDSRGNSCFSVAQDTLCVPQMRESWH